MGFSIFLNVILLSNCFISIFSQSALSVASDVALCTCNITPNSCDINCCCDSDCSTAIKSQFSGCILNDIVTNDIVCSYTALSYDSVTKQSSNTIISSKNGFCVYTNNYNAPTFYNNISPMSSNDLNSNISAYSLKITSDSATVVTQNKTSSVTSQFPTGFVLSGNIGYEFGKPVMRAIVNNLLINIARDPTEWWPLKSGQDCIASKFYESVLFGVNIMTGCSMSTNYHCGVLQNYTNLFLEEENTLSMYKIASFANITLTNINNWVSISYGNTQPTGTPCSILTKRQYNIMYSRTGSTQYLHNKIISVRATSTYTGVTQLTNSFVYLSTVVNFIDVTPQIMTATKLSPFLTIKLPYDFFFPIYSP